VKSGYVFLLPLILYSMGVTNLMVSLFCRPAGSQRDTGLAHHTKQEGAVVML
jgi:hypothetical protein